MQTPGFFRCRIDAMTNLRDPLAVLATRLPWVRIEALLAPMFEHRDRAGDPPENSDLSGPTQAKAPPGDLRLMASLVYLGHSYNPGDEELAARWSGNVLRQLFGGAGRYERRQPRGPTQIGRFRRDIGEEGLELPLKVATDTASGT